VPTPRSEEVSEAKERGPVAAADGADSKGESEDKRSVQSSKDVAEGKAGDKRVVEVVEREGKAEGKDEAGVVETKAEGKGDGREEEGGEKSEGKAKPISAKEEARRRRSRPCHLRKSEKKEAPKAPQSFSASLLGDLPSLSAPNSRVPLRDSTNEPRIGSDHRHRKSIRSKKTKAPKRAFQGVETQGPAPKSFLCAINGKLVTLSRAPFMLWLNLWFFGDYTPSAMRM
jgi:hypothetical protein